MRILEQCTADKLVSPGLHVNCPDSSSEIIIVEFEPQIRTIKLDIPCDDEVDSKLGIPGCGKFVYTLAFPYMQFVFCEKTLAVSMRNKPARSYGDTSLIPPLPNIYDNGQLCQPRAVSLEDAIHVFWSSTFKIDEVWSGVASLLKTELVWYDNWATMTKNDPEKALKYQWDEELFREVDIQYFIAANAKWFKK